MRKLIILTLMLLTASVGAFAQQGQNCNYWSLGLDPEDPLTPYYVWMCQQSISSPDMLPPPGSSGPVNQQPSYQNTCPAIPPEPPYIQYADGFRVYPHLVAHTYYNTPPGCAEYTWEYDPRNPTGN